MYDHGSEAIGDGGHDLLELLRRGDDGAFEHVVRTHGDYLYGVARRILRDDAGAADAVQEAFLALLRHVARFEGRCALRTWLHRLTVNAALMQMRARRRRDEVSIDELVPVIEGAREEPEWHFTETPEELSGRDEVRRHVRDCIERLPENYRIVLLLRDVEGHDTREVALLLDESEANVKVRLHRARAAVKKLLEPLWRSEAP